MWSPPRGDNPDSVGASRADSGVDSSTSTSDAGWEFCGSGLGCTLLRRSCNSSYACDRVHSTKRLGWMKTSRPRPPPSALPPARTCARDNGGQCRHQIRASSMLWNHPEQDTTLGMLGRREGVPGPGTGGWGRIPVYTCTWVMVHGAAVQLCSNVVI